MPPQIYDIHAHFYPDFYIEALEEAGWMPTDAEERAAITSWSIEAHLHFMNDNGIHKSCFFPAFPGASVYPPSEVNNKRNIQLAQRLNDYANLLKTRYSDRISFLVVLPFPNVSASCEEIIRVTDELDANGYCLFTEAFGIPVSDPSVSTILSRVLATRTPIYLHPHHPCTDTRQSTTTSSAVLAHLLSKALGDLNPTMYTIITPAVPASFRPLLAHMLDFTRLLSYPSPLTHWESTFEIHNFPSILRKIARGLVYFDLTTAGPDAFRTHVPDILGLGADHGNLMLGSAAPCGGWNRAAELLDSLNDGANDYWGLETGAEECRVVRELTAAVILD